MHCWRIAQTLEEAELSGVLETGGSFAAVLTPEEWAKEGEALSMGIDMYLDVEDPALSQAQVNYDSLTGSLRWMRVGEEKAKGFAFALDERGVVFIDRTDTALALVQGLKSSRKWHAPSLARFLYDFLEQLIDGHLPALTAMDSRLAEMERRIEQEEDDGEEAAEEINDLRGELLDLRTHYEQLIDVGQELEENENGFFSQEELRYFRMFTRRVTRLQELNRALRDYAVQVRDLYQTGLELRQNRAMNTLTVVTSVFLPLTLIVGWYGMNFTRMPELTSPWGYPGVILVSVALVAGLLIYFKRKKWL